MYICECEFYLFYACSVDGLARTWRKFQFFLLVYFLIWFVFLVFSVLLFFPLLIAVRCKACHITNIHLSKSSHLKTSSILLSLFEAHQSNAKAIFLSLSMLFAKKKLFFGSFAFLIYLISIQHRSENEINK